MVVFPAQPPDLRRSPLVARVRGQLSASPGLRRLISDSCSSARGFCSPLLSAPASRPDRSPGFFALRFARGRYDQLPPGFSPVHHLHAGHTTKPLRGSWWPSLNGGPTEVRRAPLEVEVASLCGSRLPNGRGLEHRRSHGQVTREDGAGSSSARSGGGDWPSLHLCLQRVRTASHEVTGGDGAG